MHKSICFCKTRCNTKKFRMFDREHKAIRFGIETDLLIVLLALDPK